MNGLICLCFITNGLNRKSWLKMKWIKLAERVFLIHEVFLDKKIIIEILQFLWP